LEYHHIQAYALGGPATVENIALRCRTHNAYEGVRFFGEKRTMHAASNAKKGSLAQMIPDRPEAIGSSNIEYGAAGRVRGLLRE